MGVVGKKRTPVNVWLLCIFTFGIYLFIWWGKVNAELKKFDARIEVNPTMASLSIIPGACLCYIPFIGTLWKGTNRVRQAQTAAGLPATATPALTIVLILVFGLYPLYLQGEINKVWDRYAAAEGTQVTLAA